MMPKYDTFDYQLHSVRQDFLTVGITIDRGEWQALRDDRPQMQVFECHNMIIQTKVPQGIEDWQEAVKPNLPWAEDHFQERISGEPLNPGEQYKNWPWYEQGVEEHKPNGEFSHTYMERFWPYDATADHWGIRFPYGDLNTLIDLLRSRPYTRQAYLPIWFPEDLHAAMEPERVPCTLGYHFQARPNMDRVKKPVLDVFYPMRSCDYYRYLRDDAYMAGRLLQWVAESVGMLPGKLTMHIVNLHIFANEFQRLKDEHEKAKIERMSGAY